MPNEGSFGANFSIDVSNLKSGLAQANRLIRESESEFKAAAAGMGDWSKSSDGLTAKIKSLNDIVGLQEEKVSALKKNYDQLVAGGMDPASAEAVKLRTQINNETAALEKNKAQVQELQSKLDGLGDDAEDAGKGIDEAADAAEDAADGFTIMKGALADLVSDGIQKAVGALKDLVTEMMTASSEANASFQAQTGASAEEMEKFSKSIENVYSHNFGESMQDVADAMAEVKKQTGEVDPSKLEKLTENGMTLQDTFGYDMSESMRAVNMLMKQFGLSSDEAFNFVVKGAQNGLDKNGDLLDTINEYGVHYAQQGYSADEFYNSLKNGSEAGTFSVDKLGDAMKEFGIRTKDTATTTDEGFALLGLDADEMRKSFAAGGDTAQNATKKTLEALFNMDDQVKQNQAGVDLFGRWRLCRTKIG